MDNDSLTFFNLSTSWKWGETRPLENICELLSRSYFGIMLSLYILGILRNVGDFGRFIQIQILPYGLQLKSCLKKKYLHP